MSITTITMGDPRWPRLLNDNNQGCRKPSELYFSGDLDALLDFTRPKILITGTRDTDNQIAEQVNEIIDAIARNPLCPVIISGLAIGTDTFVHTRALENRLATVAVMPCGLDNVYPNANTELAEKMLSTPGCALLSQYPEQTAPIALNFIMRNTTMALMSDFAIIVASKVKGGSIVCARLMNDLKKTVFAVPGSPDDIRHQGCNMLIANKVAELLYDYKELESETIIF